ncbi:MAG: hypothetical protein J6T10_27555 [Methanobrevibacter sp.]|nr:hypothetical protein [Methanobrevibacter sp.]
MKKLLIILATMILVGCAENGVSAVSTNGCHEETVHYNEVCDWTNSKYDANACYQVETAMQLKGETSITIEVCE